MVTTNILFHHAVTSVCVEPITQAVSRHLDLKPLASLKLPSLVTTPRLPTFAIIAEAPVRQQLAEIQDQIFKHTGGRVVFSRDELAEGTYYDKLPPLSLERQARAAEIALRELRKYPAGILAQLGLKTFGIFEACISNTNDGYHEYDARYAGYRWYGLYNFKHGAVGAYYSDTQLPLTIHHELFHAIDAHHRGHKELSHYESDNERFSRAIRGEEPYPPLSLDSSVLANLKKISRGVVLQDAVSQYTLKSPDEDQAEAARHFMMNIADSLIQASERPQLAGSQRILHILEQYRTSVDKGPDVRWFASVALGHHLSPSVPTPPAPQTLEGAVPTDTPTPESITRSLFETITNEKRAFIVRGEAADDYTPNPTLQQDIRDFASRATQLMTIEKRTQGRYSSEGDLREILGLLEAYEGFVNLNYKVSRETREVFRATREAILKLLPEQTRRTLFPRLVNFHYLGKVDRAIHRAFSADPQHRDIAAKIKGVQPAVVSINRASGFNINPEGTILTNAHVALELNKTMTVQFPNGEIFEGECSHIDSEIDLALVKLKGVKRPLPYAKFSQEEAPIGSDIVVIGQPDTYDRWHVSTGKILNYHPHPHTAVDGYPLGGTEHSGWTFWGNSGSPILNLAGLVVGAHNTYDDKRNMRCAVRHQPTIEFLKRAKASFEFGR